MTCLVVGANFLLKEDLVTIDKLIADTEATYNKWCHSNPYIGFSFKEIPAVTIIIFFQILFSTIQFAVFALIAVRDLRAWVLKLDMGMIAILYQFEWCGYNRGRILFCDVGKSQ